MVPRAGLSECYHPQTRWPATRPTLCGLRERKRRLRHIIGLVGISLLILLVPPTATIAQGIVPGTGSVLPQVGDDFEDVHWEYHFHSPKSSRDLDGQERLPAGYSANGRWYESVKRGHPDIIRRVDTPRGGLPGSRGSLLLQTLQTGIPGQPGFRLAQDDLVADVSYRLGGAIPVARGPSVVVRLFLPPIDQWEKRSGPHFGFRVALETAATRRSHGRTPVSTPVGLETYWPGIFIEFESKPDGGQHDYAHFRLRANRYGNDYRSRQIPITGWWTLGISVTPDGAVHYFAKPGVEHLTAADHLASEYPYGFRALTFKTFFFNVCTSDDGKSWSTPWILDDPAVYLLH